MEHLRDLEETLFIYSVRQDPFRLKELLHNQHQRIEADGTRRNKLEVIALMQQETPPKRSFWTQNFTYMTLDNEDVQIRYLYANIKEDSRLFNHTQRTAVWRLTGDNWQQLLHCIEPCEPFCKSSN